MSAISVKRKKLSCSGVASVVARDEARDGLAAGEVAEVTRVVVREVAGEVVGGDRAQVLRVGGRGRQSRELGAPGGGSEGGEVALHRGEPVEAVGVDDRRIVRLCRAGLERLVDPGQLGEIAGVGGEVELALHEGRDERLALGGPVGVHRALADDGGDIRRVDSEVRHT